MKLPPSLAKSFSSIAPLHSAAAGDLALDRRIDATRVKQAAQAIAQRADTTAAQPHAPQPLMPNTHKPSSKTRLLDRFVSSYGIGDVAQTLTGFPRKYLSTTHNTPVGAPTDQKRSGRCWIFANLNVLRTQVLERYGDKFAYAQNYVAYWDKLERANAFLEKMMEMGALPADHQRVLNHLEHAFKEGGDWELFRNIVVKYGLVPDYAMPETNFSGNAKGYMALLESRLREVGGVLHQKAQAGASAAELQSIKNAALAEVRRVCNRYLGTPPERFIWQNTDGKLTHMTPLAFYADSGCKLEDMVHLSNLPYLPMNTRVTVDDVNNVVGAPGMSCLNVDMNEIKVAVRRSIKDGVPVMFAAETREADFTRNLFAVGSNSTECIAGLDTMPRLGKGERLKYRVTALAHAMTLTGCDDAGTNHYAGQAPTKAEAELTGPLWKVENSWKDRETLYMTDAWFDQYVYAVVVAPKYLSRRTKALANDAFAPTRRVDAWDPLGRI